MSQARNRKKIWNASRFCVSSLRRGHANLLCIVPILSYVRPTPYKVLRIPSRSYTFLSHYSFLSGCLLFLTSFLINLLITNIFIIDLLFQIIFKTMLCFQIFPKSSWNGDHRRLVVPASGNGHVREMRKNLYKNGESFHSDWKWLMRSERKESHH